MTRTAAYVRISQDRSGEGLSLDRQRIDCQKVADDRGWTITEWYVDNDISAYSGKTRPGFEALLADIEARRFDAIVTYHQDRLTRQPAEFEKFLATCDHAGVKLFATAQGDTDIGEGDGIMVARIFAAVAANQSDAASRRIRRKNDERAAAGKPHSTGNRAFGYADDRVTIVESEAEVIRQLVSRYLAGDSIISLTAWLQSENVRTVTGKEWRTPTVRNLLRAPRIAGLREHRGEVVGPAVWDGIITPARREQILHRMEQTAAKGDRTPRTYLLSGKVYCGNCGAKMVSSTTRGRRRYGCRTGPDFLGCGKVYVAAESLEDLIVDAVLTRLDTPEVVKAVTELPDDDAETSALSREIADDTAQLDELTDAYSSRQLSMRDWLRAKKPIEERLDAAKRRLARLNSHIGLTEHVGKGATLRQAWTGPDMTLQTQAAIIGTVLDRVVILPAKKQANRLDFDRVKPKWVIL